MPHPLFGAKEAYYRSYIEKKVGTKKVSLGKASLYCVILIFIKYNIQVCTYLPPRTILLQLVVVVIYSSIIII